MKTFKKLFAYSAIFALLATMMPTYANAASYDAELTEAYAYAKNKWITTMTSIDNADMYGNLTRVAMAKMVANYVLDLGLQELDTDKECNFPDVSASLDEAYDNGVTKACQLGLMGVGIEKFNPNGIVTRAEFGTVLSRALWGDEYNGADPYYKDHLQALKDEGIMNIIDNPNMKEVRGYVMLMMMRADDAYTPTTGCSAEELLACILADDYDACIAACSEDAEEEDTRLPGFATVSRVWSTTDQTIARNSVAKKIGTIKLTAGENDTTVSSIVIGKTGLGNGEVHFRIMKDGVKVGTKAKLKNNKSNVTVRFSPSLALKANSSMTFDVVADFIAEQHSYFTFSVLDVNVANWKSAWTPVELGKITTTSYKVDALQSVTVTEGEDQKAWEKDKSLMTVTITPKVKETLVDGFVLSKATAATNEDLSTLFSNVKAYMDWEEVGAVAVYKDEIVVSNLNVTRSFGEAVTIELRSDCVFVWDHERVELYIDENDVIAKEVNTGERVPSTESNNAFIYVDGVDLVATNEITATKTVAPWTSSVELFKAKITTNAEFEITDYTLKFTKWTGQLTTGDFSAIIAYINGVDYELDIDNGDIAWSFDPRHDSFIVDKWLPTVISVIGHVHADNPGEGYQIEFEATTGKNMDNVSMPINNGLVLWHVTNVQDGWVRLSKRVDAPINKTVVEWTLSEMLFFKLRASAEDQRLTGLTINSSTWFDMFATKLELMAGNKVIKTISDPTLLSGTTSVTFDNISHRLKKDTDENFSVRVTLKWWEVKNLWSQVELFINSGDVKTARVWNIKTDVVWNITWTNYYIASNAPSIAFGTQQNKKTEFIVTNNSSYFVEVQSVKYEVSRNEKGDGFMNWSATWFLLQNINDDADDKISNEKELPGEMTATIDAGSRDLIDTSLSYTIELLAPSYSIVPAHYTITIKELEYVFIDKVTEERSELIKESYNVIK